MKPHSTAITLYGVHLSGHVHRVEMLLTMLELPYTFVEAPAEVRSSAEFRHLNPFGQIPVLIDGELVICDSNAILVYLVKRYAPTSSWLPDDAVAAAQVQRWLSIAAGELKFGPAAARVALQWGKSNDAPSAGEIANRLLGFMEMHLAERFFLAVEHATLADLACYSYVAHAPEGGISLAPFPQVRAWLKRVEALPRFKPMPQLPIKAVA
ncbi:MAG TPA: glutathione S-transferase [Burkholderiaceae bacterium]|jgi:glutathione S-transferase|nr:glutathione S-transferase [Burkholderiaceae bacterium]